MKKIIVFVSVLVFIAVTAFAQVKPDFANLDPNPYDPSKEPDADMFISNWRDSMPRNSHGSLVERDILTPAKGDPMKPEAKGAVLTALKAFSHGVLDVGATMYSEEYAIEAEPGKAIEAEPGKAISAGMPKDIQEIFYIESGNGILKSGKKTWDIHEGIGILIPPEIEYTLTNIGAEPLNLYLMTEAIPADFKPRKDILVKDENVLPYASSNVHWSHCFKMMFDKSDGLASLTGLGPVWFSPMTMGQPHSHEAGVEEIWFGIDGDIHLLLGKQFRHVPNGTAYKIPPNGSTPHANINSTDKPIKMFWMMRQGAPYKGPVSVYGNLDPEPYNPDKDANIDMYISSWKNSMPKHTHGSLIERDVMTKGDPFNPKVKGGVLKYVNRFTRAELLAHAVTTPYTPKGEQELFYVESGKGIVTGGGKSYDVSAGTIFLAPENLEFTIQNTGDESMIFYLVVEPTPKGFRPNNYIVVHSEKDVALDWSDSHWINCWCHLIKPEEGLAQLQLVLTVWLLPNSFAQPHSHNATTEEVWVTLDGDVKALLGKQIRDIPPGTAYLIPPDDKTPHANFDVSDKPIKFFYFARFKDMEPRK